MQKQLKLIKKNKNYFDSYNLNYNYPELNTYNYREILFYYNKENLVKDSPLFTLNRDFKNEFFVNHKIHFNNSNLMNNHKIFLEDFKNIIDYYKLLNPKKFYSNYFILLEEIANKYISLFSKNSFSTNEDFLLNSFNRYCLNLLALKKKIENDENYNYDNEFIRYSDKIIFSYDRYKKDVLKLTNTVNKSTNESSIIFFFRFLRNNVFGLITTEDGKILSSISSGKLGYKGKKKISIIAVKDIANWLIEDSIKKKLNTKYFIQLKYKGWSTAKSGLTHFFSRRRLRYKIRLHIIKDNLSIPHNGCRPPKKSRK
jgi:small subunit ribosomal protein S11